MAWSEDWGPQLSCCVGTSVALPDYMAGLGRTEPPTRLIYDHIEGVALAELNPEEHKITDAELEEYVEGDVA